MSVLEGGRTRTDWAVVVVLVFAAFGFLVAVTLLALVLARTLAGILV